MNEEIKLNTTTFKPIEIIGELPSTYRVFNVEVKHNNGTVTYRQLHELHLIELRKRGQNNKQLWKSCNRAGLFILHWISNKVT